MSSSSDVVLKPEPACLVCGDRASGRHYGVPSCDGCRGFFKRSVRRNLEYACKEQGRCTVDVARRNQCQACRLKKCLAVHMRREAVQHERASRSQPKRRPRMPGPDFPHRPYCPPPAPLLRRPTEEDPTTRHPPQTHHANDLMSSDTKTADDPLSGDDLPPASPPRLIPYHHQPCYGPLDESAARLLFLAVRWMRTVPSFLQLSFRDQAILMEEAWSDVFVLSAAQWGFPIQEGFLSFASMTSPDRRPLVASQLHQMKSVLSQLVTQQVDPTEFSCLKALALFRPESPGLRDPLQVEMLQDQTQLMLHEYVLTRKPPSKVRFGRLLLLLSQVRRVGPHSVEEAFFRRTIGQVPIERLLCDMFQAA